MKHAQSTWPVTVSLALLALLALPVSGAAARAPAQVQARIAPAQIQVPAGQTADVAVELSGVDALYAADVQLTFDPGVVEVVDANPELSGVQIALGTFLDPGFAIVNEVDNGAGTLRFVMTQLNPSQPKSGSGTLIVVKLRGRQAGRVSPLTLVSVVLAQRDGTKLPVSLTSGQVQVVDTLPGPTYTPIPTQGPGTPMPTGLPPEPTQAAAPSSTPSSTPLPSPSPTATPTARPALATAVSTATSAVGVIPTNTPAGTGQPTLAPNSTPAASEGPATEPPAPTAGPVVGTGVPPAAAPAEIAVLVVTATPGPATPQPAAPPLAAITASPLLMAGIGILGLVAGFGLAFLTGRRRSKRKE